ncbi:carbohydrate ABC transporter permease [Agrobacterium vitis]|uniref:sn-glycerol-3-phosphate transport system permease protein UgpE n=1 Tax=Agrobacterium vitis TaxID=373 RepID=A0AAE4WGQ3_AGRVI|nr:carbohydrate ABC transporter permease [Agrobacterium vitis]MCF1499983.1 carbohydrate ABC transporter permease [Allorhizobium sp. Av2]MCM2442332.1 carbohydrate ABC transporter permease [Agrobacterium vitis]MUZ58742.1 ABC transporter permease subunit [Agrobacterium vitis]MVA66377.1 ABC transporter permease subunit [Agrobacterium vitis]MVA88414.1 ABC transporter permease subunit [Agrobacterium vitis]
MARSTLRAFLSHAVLLGGAFLMVYPFFWMWRASTQAPGEIFGSLNDTPPILTSISENYTRALFDSPLPRFMLNGVIMTGGILLFQILTTVTCAYALAKFKFRGQHVLFAIVLISLSVPAQATALPIFMVLAKFGLLDTYAGVMLPYLTSGFAIFMFYQFIRSFPDEILLAARLDGMSEIEIVVRIILPAMKPAIAAFAIFSITFHWNDLYWPMIVIRSIDLSPPTLGLLFFRSQEGGDSFGPLMACATLITAPLILLFLAAQRGFVQGVTMTGVK